MATEIKNEDLYLAWEGGAAIDGDGARTVYHPDGKSGLDYLQNAKKKDGTWVGVVTDKKGNPVVQGPNDPAPGFYISPTSLQDKSKGATDPTRYVDSESVPYISVPKNALQMGVKLGDIAWVSYKGQEVFGVVADCGPVGKFGEISIKCAKLLDIPSSPKNGGCSKGVRYIIFKNTATGWPRDLEEVEGTGRAILDNLPGVFGSK